MKELGKATIVATDILSFPKGSIVEIGELEEGEELASGDIAEGGELVAFVTSGDSTHDVDICEDDFIFLHSSLVKDDQALKTEKNG